MSVTRIAALAAAGLLSVALAACGGGGTTSQAPSAPAASSPAASAPAASSPGASPSAAGEVCAPAEGPGDVTANATGLAFDPATVNVTAGQSVTWSNGDTVPHSIVLDGGQCQSENFAGGASATLVFNVAGSYPFHCGVHPTMTGTIEVAG